MKRLIAAGATLMLAGCVILTEDGRKVVSETGETLLAPFIVPGTGLAITTEAGDVLTDEAGGRILVEALFAVLTEAGDLLTTETPNTLRIEFP